MDMDKKIKQFADMMRQLVSDVQGAPYPGEDLEMDLYKIWYEHVQRNAQNCYEFLDENFPKEQEEFEKSINNMFK